MTPHLARITVFPVKSLQGVSLGEARVRGGGGLLHDREYRFADDEGLSLNSKRMGEKLIRLESSFDLAFGELRVADDTGAITARLPSEAALVERWMSERLGCPAHLERDDQQGFPDDEEASGPTLVSTATLAAVAEWFDLDTDEMRRRLRANLEIDGVPAFWEDRLYAAADQPRYFRLGDVRIEAVNPCARCTVPSRDSRSGSIADKRFAKVFAGRRRDTLPEWAEAARFDHYYRAAVNTRIPEVENGKILEIGDELRVAT